MNQYGSLVSVKTDRVVPLTDPQIGSEGKRAWEVYFSFEGNGCGKLNWTISTGIAISLLGKLF